MTEIRKTARSMLISEEGWRNKAYPDPLTKGPPWTIGVGHTGPEVHEGLYWSDDKVSEVLDADIAKATVECNTRFAPWFQHLNDARQSVLVSMVFQMGLPRVIGFKQALNAMKTGSFEQAAAEMLDSYWAKQTPARAGRMARQMASGEWPE